MTVEQTVRLAASCSEMICCKCEIKEYYYTSEEARENGWTKEDWDQWICPHCWDKG